MPSQLSLKLSFTKPHLSLQELPAVELPSLTVLTGINGVGKTHLLLAIKEGAVAVEGASQREILYFDWTSMYKLSSKTIKREEIRATRKKLRNKVSSIRKSAEPELRRLLENAGVRFRDGDPWNTLRADRSLLEDVGVRDLIDRANSEFIDFVNLDKADRIFLQLHFEGEEPILLSERELELIHRNHPVGHEGFAVSDIGKVMMSYFELRTHNRLCKLDEDEGRIPDLPVLTDEQFEELYGPPPWEVLTKVMQDLGLDFEIPGPYSYSTPEYTPRAVKRSTGIPVDLENLSSGEKMLMALALSSYATITRGTREAVKVKLVLLDEIDAPLHPSMSRVMMKIIMETMQQRMGYAVILATHSPATVVVAPEESIYVMRPGEPGIHAQSRERALRLLTSELPMLSLDFSGRRQVFVESDHDARRYESLYRLYERHLNSELSLSFIGVGIETDEGSRGSGCHVVREMVSKLREYGNKSVWGLVDWDGTAQNSAYVKVLAVGRRYAIENLLLDPLLVAALVIDADDRADLTKLGLEGNQSITALLAPEASDERHRVIRAVEQRVLGSGGEEKADRLKVAYFGGFTHEVSSAYLRYRGHDLATRLLTAGPAHCPFPSLRRHRDERKLLERSIKLLKENPGLLPRELLDVLTELLQPDL